MKNLIFLLFALIILSSCSSGLNITIKNGSQETFNKVIVEFPKEKFEFTNLKSGEKTEKITVNGSFAFFPTTIITGNDTITKRGFCPVGEKFYKSGKLKMILTLEEYEGKKYINFTKE